MLIHESTGHLYIFPLWSISFSFCLFQIRFVFHYWDLGVLRIFLIEVLCQRYMFWIFCPIYDSSFIFLTMSLINRILIFTKFNLQCSSFMVYSFLHPIQEIFIYPMIVKIFSMFPFRSSIGLTSTFWFLIHPRLISVIHYL